MLRGSGVKDSAGRKGHREHGLLGCHGDPSQNVHEAVLEQCETLGAQYFAFNRKTKSAVRFNRKEAEGTFVKRTLNIFFAQKAEENKVYS